MIIILRKYILIYDVYSSTRYLHRYYCYCTLLCGHIISLPISGYLYPDTNSRTLCNCIVSL